MVLLLLFFFFQLPAYEPRFRAVKTKLISDANSVAHYPWKRTTKMIGRRRGRGPDGKYLFRLRAAVINHRRTRFGHWAIVVRTFCRRTPARIVVHRRSFFTPTAPHPHRCRNFFFSGSWTVAWRGYGKVCLPQGRESYAKSDLTITD